MSGSSVLAFIVKEFKEMVPPTIFFAVGFNLILLTTQLILDDYRVQFLSFMLATTAALMVGKSVLVANAMPFLGRFDTAPLIWPVVYKSASISRPSSWCASSKRSFEYAVHGGTLAGGAGLRDHAFHLAPVLRDPDLDPRPVPGLHLHHELNELFGDGELYRILFTWRSSDLKLTRRQRIRILTKLSRLTAAHTPDELRDSATRGARGDDHAAPRAGDAEGAPSLKPKALARST